MKETLTFANAADFTQRYADTFGWLLKDNKRLLVHVTDVSRDNVFFSDLSGFRFNVKADSGIFFEFIPVDRGWFNGKSGAVYLLERHPARQWRRGICTGNTYLYRLKKTLGPRDGVTLPDLADIFNDNDPNVRKDWKNPPMAISKHFAIAGDATVYFYNRPIGKLENNRVVLENDLLYQEISDQIRRKNLPFGVAING